MTTTRRYEESKKLLLFGSSLFVCKLLAISYVRMRRSLHLSVLLAATVLSSSVVVLVAFTPLPRLNARPTFHLHDAVPPEFVESSTMLVSSASQDYGELAKTAAIVLALGGG